MKIALLVIFTIFLVFVSGADNKWKPKPYNRNVEDTPSSEYSEDGELPKPNAHNYMGGEPGMFFVPDSKPSNGKKSYLIPLGTQ